MQVERLNNRIYEHAGEIEDLKYKAELQLQEQMYVMSYVAQRRKLAYADSEAPAAEEIREYASYLGIDPELDAKWMWIAEEAISCPLPPSWEGMQDDNGAPFFYNKQTDKSQYAHPMDEYFRTLFSNLKSVGTRYGKVSEEELRTENLRLAEELVSPFFVFFLISFLFFKYRFKNPVFLQARKQQLHFQRVFLVAVFRCTEKSFFCQQNRQAHDDVGRAAASHVKPNKRQIIFID